MDDPLHTLDTLPASGRGGILAIGNFDGVHRGHQAVIAAARKVADTQGAPLGVMVFDPHPRVFFAPDTPPLRLTQLQTRARLLAEAGADFTLALPFTAEMAARTPAQFIDDILRDALDVRGVVVGHDFRFGKGRAGTTDDLAAAGGFEVITIDAQTPDEKDAPPYSSSAIRAALQAGRPREAAAQLARTWTIEGVVETGDRRGQTIGFPTANIALGDYLRPAFGVYAVRVETGDGTRLEGVANLGLRPTFGTDAPRLEVHLFDFDGDLYGQALSVGLIDFIRPEKKFDGLEALKAQIAEDATAARQILARA